MNGYFTQWSKTEHCKFKTTKNTTLKKTIHMTLSIRIKIELLNKIQH